jgi:HAD superfamily hydrolase (TIGR01509 family)
MPANDNAAGRRMDRRILGDGSGHGPLKAVLMDMDGTLCETEPVWMACEQAMADRAGVEWTVQDGLALVGFDLLDAAAYMKERMGLIESPAQIVEEMVDTVAAEVRAVGVEWRPGALDLVESCNEAGVPVALVTMSYRTFAESVTAAMPRGQFDAIVAGDEVGRGKPAPEPYLTAAARLGVEASDCVAIEDSPTGAASAHAAGCRVVVVPNHVPVPLSPDMVEHRTLSGVAVEGLASLLPER